MKNRGKFVGFSVVFVLMTFCIYLFQNCSQSSQFSVSDEERAYYENTSEKTVEIDVKDRASAPNNLKIAFFVDESASMLTIKNRVSLGLESLARRITGLRAAVRFYGISQISYELANVNSTTLDADQFVDAKNVFNTSAGKLGVIPNNFSTIVTSNYKNLQPVTVNSENGRISLARVLANDSDQSFFKTGDIGVAVVISDEDDPVSTEQSLTSSHFKIPGKLQREIKFEYNVTNIGYTYRSTVSDGSVSNQIANSGSVNLNRTRLQCPTGILSPQDPSILAVLRDHYSNQPEIANNLISVTNCNSDSTYTRRLAESDFLLPTGMNFSCTMTDFKYKNSSTVYKTVLDFSKSAIASFGYELNSLTPCEIGNPLKADGTLTTNAAFERNLTAAKSLKTLMTEQTGKNTVNEYIRERALQLFGENKFYFVAVVNKLAQDTNCPLASEQKVGRSYMELATLLNGKAHSICAPSYANVMDELSQFISKEIDGYHIPTGRRINSATLIKPNGSKTLLVLDVDFRFDGEFFALISDKPQAGDKVIIKYQ